MSALEKLREKAEHSIKSLTSLEYTIWRLDLIGSNDGNKTLWDAQKAAAENAAKDAVIEAARALMDTFDEFGNFNYSSEYVDALAAKLAELDGTK